MKNYLVLEPTTIVADKIRLTKDQATRRAHLLKKGEGRDVYTPTGILTFKAGEEIGLEDVSKINMARLKCLEGKIPEEKDEGPKSFMDKVKDKLK